MSVSAMTTRVLSGSTPPLRSVAILYLLWRHPMRTIPPVKTTVELWLIIVLAVLLGVVTQTVKC